MISMLDADNLRRWVGYFQLVPSSSHRLGMREVLTPVRDWYSQQQVDARNVEIDED